MRTIFIGYPDQNEKEKRTSYLSLFIVYSLRETSAWVVEAVHYHCINECNGRFIQSITVIGYKERNDIVTFRHGAWRMFLAPLHHNEFKRTKNLAFCNEHLQRTLDTRNGKGVIIIYLILKLLKVVSKIKWHIFSKCFSCETKHYHIIADVIFLFLFYRFRYMYLPTE